MNITTADFISLDLPALLTATFASLSCALLGNFLLLRRLSLMGDAISHSVLPGIVIAFLVTGSRLALPVFIGAAIAGVVSVVAVELVHRLGRLDTGASMGVVFSIFFATGVLLIEQAAARSVDLDAECLLHGQLETIFWYPPGTLREFFSLSTLDLIPGELLTSLSVFVLSSLFVGLLYKELALAAFDPGLATALGFRAPLLHMLTMIFLAASVVASFEAVGSILVIAMIICPPACARMFTDRLSRQIFLSLLFAVLCSAGGYLLGAFGPYLFGSSHSLNAAGMMATVAGVLLLASALCAPAYGYIPRSIRRFKLQLQVLEEDILSKLFRDEETLEVASGVPAGFAAATAPEWIKRRVFKRLRGKEEISGYPPRLLPAGRDRARSLVRSHRLWESYLVTQGGIAPEHVHESAEQFEHFTASELRERLAQSAREPAQDPHGRKIPSEKP